jgi:hypothetical protein
MALGLFAVVGRNFLGEVWVVTATAFQESEPSAVAIA